MLLIDPSMSARHIIALQKPQNAGSSLRTNRGIRIVAIGITRLWQLSGHSVVADWFCVVGSYIIVTRRSHRLSAFQIRIIQFLDAVTGNSVNAPLGNGVTHPWTGFSCRNDAQATRLGIPFISSHSPQRSHWDCKRWAAHEPIGAAYWSWRPKQSVASKVAQAHYFLTLKSVDFFWTWIQIKILVKTWFSLLGECMSWKLQWEFILFGPNSLLSRHWWWGWRFAFPSPPMWTSTPSPRKTLLTFCLLMSDDFWVLLCFPSDRSVLAPSRNCAETTAMAGKSRALRRKSKTPQKNARNLKWTLLSLAFYNTPSFGQF